MLLYSHLSAGQRGSVRKLLVIVRTGTKFRVKCGLVGGRRSQVTQTQRASIWAGAGEEACCYRYSWSSMERDKGHGDSGQDRCHRVKHNVYRVSERRVT